MKRVMKHMLANHRCALLTAVELMVFVIAPFCRPDSFAEGMLEVALSLLLLFAPYFISRDIRVFKITITVGGVMLLPKVLSMSTQFGHFFDLPDSVDAILMVSVLLFEVCITAWAAYSALAKGESPEPVFSCVLTYILLITAFGNAYRIFSKMIPDTFFLEGQSISLTLNQAIYFSTTTLSTCGYGDILPGAPLSRMLASVEMICGVLFIALFVGRMMAFRACHHDDDELRESR